MEPLDVLPRRLSLYCPASSYFIDPRFTLVLSHYLQKIKHPAYHFRITPQTLLLPFLHLILVRVLRIEIIPPHFYTTSLLFRCNISRTSSCIVPTLSSSSNPPIISCITPQPGYCITRLILRVLMLTCNTPPGRRITAVDQYLLLPHCVFSRTLVVFYSAPLACFVPYPRSVFSSLMVIRYHAIICLYSHVAFSRITPPPRFRIFLLTFGIPPPP